MLGFFDIDKTLHLTDENDTLHHCVDFVIARFQFVFESLGNVINLRTADEM